MEVNRNKGTSSSGKDMRDIEIDSRRGSVLSVFASEVLVGASVEQACAHYHSATCSSRPIDRANI